MRGCQRRAYESWSASSSDLTTRPISSTVHRPEDEVNLILGNDDNVYLVPGPQEKVDIVPISDDEVNLVHGPKDDVDLISTVGDQDDEAQTKRPGRRGPYAGAPPRG